MMHPLLLNVSRENKPCYLTGDFNMNLLEPGYAYGLKFAFYDNSTKSWQEQKESFKFRVESYEY